MVLKRLIEVIEDYREADARDYIACDSELDDVEQFINNLLDEWEDELESTSI